MSIKEVMVSRFKDGLILELDVKQLEIVVAAYMSQDLTLIQDIVDGTDLHLKSLSLWKKRPYIDLVKMYDDGLKDVARLRTLAKSISFQLLYGSTAYGIARQFNMSKTAAEEFITNYYSRYYRLKQWQEENIKSVEANALPVGTHENGMVMKRSSLYLETGRELRFKTYEPRQDWIKNAEFSPTQIKNYPVQALATDFFQTMLGKMFRFVREQWSDGSVLLVNTVHDSIIFDIQNSSDIINISKQLKDRSERINQDLIDIFDIDIFPLKLQVDVEWGKSWGSLTEHL